MKKTFRNFTLLGATGTSRIATYQGVDHVVVPVVGLMEGVVQPANSREPEFVPASVLKTNFQGWNGRPVMLNHPKDSKGEFISANDPTVLEKGSFGCLFNTGFKDDKLLLEAWMDPGKAKNVGEKAERVLERFKANEMVEISVGAFLGLEERRGVFKGKPYARVWTEITQDHLAMLEEGLTGACSIKMGCGALRVATNLVTTGGLVGLQSDIEELEDDADSFLDRARRLLRLNVEPKGPSNRDMMRAISKSLRAEEPGFLGVEEIWPEDGIVVYATMPEDEVLLFRRKFTFESGQDKAALNSRKEKVELDMTFKAASAGHTCKCEGEKDMKTKKERVAALIANTKLKLKTEQADELEKAPDTVIESLEAAATALAEPPKKEDPPAPEKKEDPPKVLTVDEYIAAAPPALQSVLRENLRVAEAAKTAKIEALKATKKCDFTDDELKALSTEQLDKIIKMAGITTPTALVDYSGRQLPPDPSIKTENKNKVDPPPSLHKAIRIAQGVEKVAS